MSVTIYSTTPIVERRHSEHEAYVRFERERLTTDEITEASERLAGVMYNPFEYTYGEDGELYFQGESLKSVFVRGIQKAEEVVKHYPQFSVELLRRHIELQQYIAQREIGRQSDDDPLVLFHISMMPDVVNEGVDLGAYDTERQKIMVRTTQKVAGGVRTISGSFDGGNRLGVQAMGDVAGVDISDDATSEDILALNFYVPESELKGKDLMSVLRKRYDDAMKLQYGGEWYAGRRDAKQLDTLRFIESNRTIVDEYIRIIEPLKERYGQSFRKSKEYEAANYDFMALLTRRYEDNDYAGSMGDAGDAARENGEVFASSDCPTGDNLSLSAQEALGKQGIGSQWEFGNCRVCMEDKLVGECSVCKSCENADNRGESLDRIHLSALKRRAKERRRELDKTHRKNKENSPTATSVRRSQEREAKRIYGRTATIRERKRTGMAVLDVVNGLTGKVFASDIG